MTVSYRQALLPAQQDFLRKAIDDHANMLSAALGALGGDAALPAVIAKLRTARERIGEVTIIPLDEMPWVIAAYATQSAPMGLMEPLLWTEIGDESTDHMTGGQKFGKEARTRAKTGDD